MMEIYLIMIVYNTSNTVVDVHRPCCFSTFFTEMNDADGRNWDFDVFPALKNGRRKNEEQRMVHTRLSTYVDERCYSNPFRGLHHDADGQYQQGQ